ncbi:hypothetical protein SAMN05421803_113131 [Nocardiopsis flavescens]|uniref:Uncharacterized protein n=1 Tax=Nocardiopsis flavescens TaxID=758803 RepID=A0A1M6PLK6_9ACTN|nr:hypothetical protein SAMN05421803_113131 [Nocardiopsis flavescens]
MSALVSTYLPAPGFFAGRLREQAEAEGATAVSEGPALAPEPAEIVWERYGAAPAARRVPV